MRPGRRFPWPVALVLALVAATAAVQPADAAVPRATALTVQALAPDAVQVGAAIAPDRRRTAYHASYARVGARGWRRTSRRRLPRGPRARRVGVQIGGLRPSTAYRVRVVVTTCGGCPSGTTRSTTRRVRTAPPVASPVEWAAPPEPSRTPPLVQMPEAPLPAPAVDGFANPVYDADFPDPFVLREGDAWYAYGTGAGFPILRSTDLVTWTPAGYALAERPAWTTEAPWSPGMRDWHPWAPSVQRVDTPCPGATEGPCFLLFHVGLTDQDVPEFMHCVGVAASRSPTGPFTVLGRLEREDGVRERGMPIGCGDAAGDGTIDPAPFVASDGKAYLYVSTDRSCGAAGCGYAPTISVIPLSQATPWRAAGPRVPLLAGAPGTWEQGPAPYPVAENPSVVERDGVFQLLYSGGDWRAAYGMGHATADSPTGPFVRSSPDPWVWGDESVSGPGGGMLIADAAGGDWLAYHARRGPGDQPRTLRLDRVTWDAEGRPRLDGPTSLPQAQRPAPLG